MPLAAVAHSLAVATLAALALVGLVVRRKLDVCRLFPIYLLSAATGHALLASLPGVFWTWDFMALTDGVQVALRLGIAFEVAFKIFRAPLLVGRRRVRAMFALVTIGLSGAMLLYPWQHVDAFELTLAFGRVSYGVAVLFMVFLLVAFYYSVPIDPLHRAIASGFAFTSAVLAFGHVFSLNAGWGRHFVTILAYPVVMAGWAYCAWRRDSLAGLSPEALRVLWPWRAP